MTDIEIYEVIMQNLCEGWGNLYEKYTAPPASKLRGLASLSNRSHPSPNKYRQKFINAQKGKFEWIDLGVIWDDAIQIVAEKVKLGKFTIQEDKKDDFLLRLIGKVAYNILRNEWRKKHPNQPLTGVEEAEEIDVTPSSTLDMLKAWISTLALREKNALHAEILMLKYFPDSPDLFGLTNEQLIPLLSNRGFAGMTKDKVKVYHKRALKKMKEKYDELKQATIEAEERRQDEGDYTLINAAFPTPTFWNLFWAHKSAVLASDYLEEAKADEAVGMELRLFQFPSDLNNAKDFYPDAKDWNLDKVKSCVTGIFKMFLSSDLFRK